MEQGSVTDEQWFGYVERLIGFVLPKSQQLWLTNAIEQFAASSAMSVEMLWQALPNDSTLRQRFIDHVVIVQTHFFRHKPSMTFVSRALTQLMSARLGVNADKPKADKIKVWCAACSTGQEVWSLAMMLYHELSQLYDEPEVWLPHLCIVGTDVSASAINLAKQGIYSSRHMSEIPDTYHAYVQPLVGYQYHDRAMVGSLNDVNGASLPKANANERWQVSDRLRPMVQFAQRNLFFMQQKYEPELYDVVFCQNMLIYFREFDQRDLLANFVQQCRVGGYLLLAPGEAVSWQHPLMRRVKRADINAWQKIATEA